MLNIIFYARVLVPSYIQSRDFDNRDGDYAPYVIIDDDPDTLTNEALDEQWNNFQSEYNKEIVGDECEETDFQDFLHYLEEARYTVICVENGGIWRPQNDPAK